MTNVSSLALAAKLGQMYASDEQFLSFPLGLSWNHRSLSFMREDNDLSAVERQRFQAEFARLMNEIPLDGGVPHHTTGEVLWRAARDILEGAEFAEGALTEQEARQLAEAVDLLTDEVEGPDGSAVPVYSHKVTTYNGYRDEYFTLEMARRDAQLTADETGLPADRARVEALGVAIHQLEEDWTNLGFRDEVETAQRVRSALEVKRSPIRYRREYLNELTIAETSSVEGAGVTFCLTFFSPGDAFDPSLPWASANLTQKEIGRLVGDAPDGLKHLFPVAGKDDGIRGLTVEYSYVDVVRPWFRPEFFASGYWRLPGDAVVSDGLIPRQGRIPAYITGMLAVRNVTVRRRKSDAGKGLAIPLLKGAALRRAPAGVAGGGAGVRVVPPAARLGGIAGAVAGRPAAAARVVRVHPGAERRRGAETFFVRPASVAGGQPAGTPALGRAYAMAKLNGLTFNRAVLAAPPPPPRRADVQDEVTESYNVDGVSVLAFVCRRLPKAPAPDGRLQW